MHTKSNREDRKNQDRRTPGSGGDTPVRPELPPPQGDGRFPKSSKEARGAARKSKSKAPPPLSLEAITSRLHRIGGVDNRFRKQISALQYCGQSATLFECSGDHDIWIPRFCGKDYCPKCGEEESHIHLRRYARLVKRIGKVRYQKDIVTFHETIRPTTKDELRDQAQIIADLLMVWYDVPAVAIVVHWLGEVSQGIHYEVLTPDHGKKRPEKELLQLREWIAWGLGVEILPTIKHRFNDVSKPLEEQQGRWWHGTRYATHPTGYSGRWDTMGDEGLSNLLIMKEGFHSIRGYGSWSNSRCNSKEARALEQEYPIDLGDAMELSNGVEAIGKIHHGGECPVCQKTLICFRAKNELGKLVAVDVFVPRQAVEVLEGVFKTDSSDAIRQHRRRAYRRPPRSRIKWDQGDLFAA